MYLKPPVWFLFKKKFWGFVKPPPPPPHALPKTTKNNKTKT